MKLHVTSTIKTKSFNVFYYFLKRFMQVKSICFADFKKNLFPSFFTNQLFVLPYY